MAFTLAQAKSLCNATELSLAKASGRNEIGKLTVVQVRQKVDRTRKLRDKWRDLAQTQRRATQVAQRARQTDANARSAEKAELFGEVLSRFEAQLATLEAKDQKGSPAPKRLPKRARSATHRAGRADIRAELKEERLALAGTKKAKSVKPAKPTKAKPVGPAPPQVEEEAETTTVGTGSKRPRKPSVPALKAGQGKRAHGGTGMTALESARELQGLHVTKGKQLRATTAAKKARLKASGIMRVQKSTSARNKRNQGKRDSR